MKTHWSSMPQAEISRAILRYLLHHPGACDSIDGIIQWWLDPLVRNASMAEVEQVLEDLCQKGILVQKTMPHSPSLYGLRTKNHQGQIGGDDVC